MPLYEVTEEALSPRPAAGFAALGLYERADLQRLLRANISVLGEDLLIVGEEFGEWEDARRRIDLLAIDRTGRLVVIEIMRTEDGGHMELQAIRYAAMISSMEFPEVVAAYASHCAKHRDGDVDARAELEAFLEVDEGEEDPVISSEVRIVLVAADFGREITTTVLWLNGFDGMDIRCVRLIPYDIDGKILLDIQQVLPLPETADYQVRLRRKDAARDRARTDGRDFTRYKIIADGIALPDENKRNAVRVMVEQLVGRGVAPDAIREVLPQRVMRVLDGIITDSEAVREAFAAADPGTQVGRWFCDHPITDQIAGRTNLLTKMWGRNTEPTLDSLAKAFPEARLSFRRAESQEE